MKKFIAGLMLISLSLTGCLRVGSEAWCDKQRDKPKGEWTLDEGTDYAKFCVLGMDSENWCRKLEEKPKGDWTANEAKEYTKNCIVDRTD